MKFFRFHLNSSALFQTGSRELKTKNFIPSFAASYEPGIMEPMKNIFNIVKISKPLHKIAYILTVLIVISAVLQLVAPVLSKFIVDQIVAQTQHKGGSMQTLIELVLLAFGANILALITSTISDRIGDHFTGELKRFLTEKFYDKVLTL